MIYPQEYGRVVKGLFIKHCCPLIRPSSTPYFEWFVVQKFVIKKDGVGTISMRSAGMYKEIGILEKSGRSAERGATRGRDWNTWTLMGVLILFLHRNQ